MRIATLGFDLDDDRVVSIDYRAPQTLLEFDLVMWDPSLVAKSFSLEGQYRGLPMVSRASSPNAISTVSRRRDEMAKLLELGKLLVIFVPSAPTFYAYTGANTNVGTAAKPRLQHTVSEIKLEKLLPLRLSLTPAEGTEMDLKVGDPFASFWRAVSKNFEYRAYFSDTPLSTAAVIRGTALAVAALGEVRGGTVLLLPDIAEGAWEVTQEETAETEERYTVPGFVDAMLATYGRASWH